jgi:hypothetical protein
MQDSSVRTGLTAALVLLSYAAVVPAQSTDKIRQAQQQVPAAEEEWGVVAPAKCFWECVQSTGCRWASNPGLFDGTRVKVEGRDKAEHEAWIAAKIGGIHPLLGPVKIDGTFFQPIVLRGSTSRYTDPLLGNGLSFSEGSRIASDPHGIHLSSGWSQRCSEEDLSNDGRPRIDSR